MHYAFISNQPSRKASVLLTDDYHMTKDAAAANGGTVPTTMPELFLALDGTETHAVSDGHHGIGRRATHVALLRRQPGNSPADDVSFQSGHDARHHPGKKTLNMSLGGYCCTSSCLLLNKSSCGLQMKYDPLARQLWRQPHRVFSMHLEEIKFRIIPTASNA